MGMEDHRIRGPWNLNKKNVWTWYYEEWLYNLDEGFLLILYRHSPFIFY